MINAVGNVTGVINASQVVNGELNKSIEYVNPVTQEKSIEPTKEVQVVEPDKGYTGLSKVTVEAISDRYDDINNFIDSKIIGGSGNLGKGNWTASVKKLPTMEFDGTNASYMFSGFQGVDIDLSKINTANATNMSYMFSNCSNLQSLDLDNLTTTKVQNMNYMFYDTSIAGELKFDNFNTSNVTNTSNMFSYFEYPFVLDISSFDTAKISNLYGMFSNIEVSKIILPRFEYLGVSFQSLFYGNGKLEEVECATNDLGSPNSIYSLCNYNSTIKTIPKIDGSNIIDTRYAFQYCTNLVNIGGFNDLGKAYDTSKSANLEEYGLHFGWSQLSRESMLNIINGVYDIKSKGVQPQRLNLYVGSKLTAEEIAIATNKGWSVN